MSLHELVRFAFVSVLLWREVMKSTHCQAIIVVVFWVFRWLGMWHPVRRSKGPHCVHRTVFQVHEAVGRIQRGRTNTAR